jgi:hypothetical protein
LSRVNFGIFSLQIRCIFRPPLRQELLMGFRAVRRVPSERSQRHPTPAQHPTHGSTKFVAVLACRRIYAGFVLGTISTRSVRCHSQNQNSDEDTLIVHPIKQLVIAEVQQEEKKQSREISILILTFNKKIGIIARKIARPSLVDFQCALRSLERLPFQKQRIDQS